jgi:hypothetical protein
MDLTTSFGLYWLVLERRFRSQKQTQKKNPADLRQITWKKRVERVGTTVPRLASLW